MFGFKKGKNEDKNIDIREVLFGDRDIIDWCNGSNFPWTLFAKAKEQIDNDDNQIAIETLKKVITAPNLESRHYLQAWHQLKKLGVMPERSIAQKVYGVILEVSLEKGLDILAAYEDHSARYFNYSGSAVIWEKPDDSLNSVIDNLINISQEVVYKIGPWDKERPKPPTKGNVRLNFLTPLGLHFGEWPLICWLKILWVHQL